MRQLKQRSQQARKSPRLQSGSTIYKMVAQQLLRKVNLTYQEFVNDPVGVLDALENASNSRMMRSDIPGYRLVSSIHAFLSKYEAHEPSITRHFKPEHVARVKWLESEAKCLVSNEEFRSRPDHLRRLFFRLRSEIESLIGYYPDEDRIFSACKFSPGASIGVHGDLTSEGHKLFAEKYTVTRGALVPFLRSLFLSGFTRESDGHVCDLWAPTLREYAGKTQIVGGNKLSFVPKTAKTHRAIAVEPLGNSFVQSGIEATLRQFLTKWGIDITRQEPNQVAAQYGSRTGRLSTIDLSAASDSISIELCRAILPPPWFELLDRVRSPYTGDVLVEKFVSMGNGFCFPLQTMIFAAICRVAECPFYRVYGDDIIVDTDHAGQVLDFLQVLGFSPNPSKTFTSGPFRESCGTDWLSGCPVRPPFARKAWTDVRSIMSFHNEALEKWPQSLQHILTDIRKAVPLSHRLVTFSHDLHSDAFRVESDEFMASPYTSFDRGTWSWRTKVFQSQATFDRRAKAIGSPWYMSRGIFLGIREEQGLPCRRKTRTRVVHTYGPDSGSVWLQTRNGA